jgi:Mycolic acid cyclopropane synthetase
MMNHLGQALWQVLVPASCRRRNNSSNSSSSTSSAASAHQHYQALRPHHLLVFYGVFQAVAATGIFTRLSHALVALASNASESFIPCIHAGWVPDCVIRFGIRLQLKHHLSILSSSSNCSDELEKKLAIVEQLKSMPIAIETDAANAQHYEVPAAFYQFCLGPNRKYSSGLWGAPNASLEESERAMLELYCQRAGVLTNSDTLSGGILHIVDLGCGWGSLTLYLAQHYPNCRITGISNSHSQREYILATARQRGLNLANIDIITVRSCTPCPYRSCVVVYSACYIHIAQCHFFLISQCRLGPPALRPMGWTVH